MPRSSAALQAKRPQPEDREWTRCEWEQASRHLPGVCLMEKLDPLLLQTGTPRQVHEQAERCLEQGADLQRDAPEANLPAMPEGVSNASG